MNYLFPPQEPIVIPIQGSDAVFPVRRVFCVGKNYADHVVEMGGDVERDPPVFFTKPADAIVVAPEAVPYPQGTEDLHYEGELVIALQSGGHNIAVQETDKHIFGYALGCDLTRRDLQAEAKSRGAPWDLAKAFDYSAPISRITPKADVGEISALSVALCVNKDERQLARVDHMIWGIDDIVSILSHYFELKAGDLIFTGTPSGVGPVTKGDVIQVEADNFHTLEFKIS